MRSASSSCGSMNDVGLVGKVYRVRRPLVSQRRMVEGSRSQRVAASLTVMRSRRRLGSVAFMGVPYPAVHARATRALLRIGMHGWACAAWRARRLRVAPSGRLLRGWVRVRWSRPPFWSVGEKRPGPWAVVVPRRPGRFFVSGQSVQVWRTSRSGVLPQVAGAAPGNGRRNATGSERNLTRGGCAALHNRVMSLSEGTAPVAKPAQPRRHQGPVPYKISPARAPHGERGREHLATP